MSFLRRLVPKRIIAFLGIMGPGLVSAIAGDDAGGIATYSLVGAQYGYQLLWVMVVITVLLAVVQEMAMRLSVVTGKGLSDLIREQFGVKTTALAMGTLFIANTAVTLSEFVGIAAAGELFGIPRWVSVPLAGGIVWYIVVRGNYKVAERIFLALGFVLVTYVISAFIVQPNWGDVARGSLIPSLKFDTNFLLVIIATIGTTISPYMQFALSATVIDKGVRPAEYKSELFETLLGVLLSTAFAYFIIVVTAATLHAHNITQIESAEQAALALAPIAGNFAEYLFGLGLMGASLLAASILPLSTTYAICEAFGWERGANQEWQDAKIFYGIYTALIVLGVIVALIPGLPLFMIFLLVYDLNGILLPILLILMIRLANDKRLMGEHVNGRVANSLAWGTALLLIGLTALLVIAPFIGLK